MMLEENKTPTSSFRRMNHSLKLGNTTGKSKNIQSQSLENKAQAETQYNLYIDHIRTFFKVKWKAIDNFDGSIGILDIK